MTRTGSSLLPLVLLFGCGGGGPSNQEPEVPQTEIQAPPAIQESEPTPSSEPPRYGTVKNSQWAPMEDYRYGDLTPCLDAGNVLFLDGDIDEFIHPGQARIDVSRFGQRKDIKFPHTVSLSIDPAGRQYGSNWSVSFSSLQLDRPLELGAYENAERISRESFKRPGLSISGDGRGCNELAGKFKITEIEWEGDRLKKFTAAFVQYCELKEPALRGCVHYEDHL